MLSRLSLKIKLTTLVVVLVTVGAYAFGAAAFQGLTGTMEEASGLGVLAAAKAFGQFVDPAWLTNYDISSGSDDHYRNLEIEFGSLVQDGYIKRITLVRYAKPGMMEYIINLPKDLSKDYVPTGTNKPLDVIREQHTPGYHVVNMNDPGTFIGGWMPIKEGDQQVGMLFLYADANGLVEMLNASNIAIISVLTVLILLSGVITYLFSASFEKAAVTDGLMGIYNHKFFKQRLEQEVARSRRYGHQTSIALLDIDFFKRVNDTYGHTTGDIVLKNLAKWIKDSCRNTDVVCRYGGEEIVLILTHTGMAGAQEFAERLRLKISQQVVRDPGENAEFRITVSVGVAQWEKGIDYMTLIKRADAALYNSKHTGRNRVSIYTEDLPLEPDKQTKAAH